MSNRASLPVAHDVTRVVSALLSELDRDLAFGNSTPANLRSLDRAAAAMRALSVRILESTARMETASAAERARVRADESCAKVAGLPHPLVATFEDECA